MCMDVESHVAGKFTCPHTLFQCPYTFGLEMRPLGKTNPPVMTHEFLSVKSDLCLTSATQSTQKPSVHYTRATSSTEYESRDFYSGSFGPWNIKQFVRCSQ